MNGEHDRRNGYVTVTKPIAWFTGVIMVSLVGLVAWTLAETVNTKVAIGMIGERVVNNQASIAKLQTEASAMVARVTTGGCDSRCADGLQRQIDGLRDSIDHINDQWRKQP